MLGVKVENLTLLPSTIFAEQNVLQNFTMSWDKGSDLIVTVQYGDGQTLNWAWDKQSHTLSYRHKSVTLSHKYATLSNVTLTVTAKNKAGQSTAAAKVVVEPNMKQFVAYKSKYTPGPTPLKVQFDFSLTAGQTSPIPVIFWCNFTYDDPKNTVKTSNIYGEIKGAGSFLTPYTYVTDRLFALPECVCYNHVSSVPFNDNITLRENITGLEITSPRKAWITNHESVIVMVKMKTGSQVKQTVYY